MASNMPPGEPRAPVGANTGQGLLSQCVSRNWGPQSPQFRSHFNKCLFNKKYIDRVS